jgi:hypothetical protein
MCWFRLPGRACRSSFRAKVLNEPGNLGSGDYPDLTRVNSMIMMREHDPQAGDVTPGNAGMPCTEFLGEGVRGLADDLQESLHRELPDPVFVPGVPAKLDDLAYFAGGIGMSATRSSSRRLTGRSETAERTSLAVLPALMLRARKQPTGIQAEP